LYRLDVTMPAFADLAGAWRPEVVCHLAAQISVRASVADPVQDARVSANVLEAARLSGAHKVLFASSVAVYGKPAALPVQADARFDPRSPYAASKLCGETYLNTYRALHGLDFTTLTLANAYGPRRRGGGWWPSSPTRCCGVSRPVCSVTARKLVITSMWVTWWTPSPGPAVGGGGGRRFNIGTGIPTSDIELHSLVAEAAGVPSEPTYAPSRPGDLPAMAVDPVPAHDGLGWLPGTSLRDGIKATVDWLRRQNR
jgi:UDP-glucose 4-epimerase